MSDIDRLLAPLIEAGLVKPRWEMDEEDAVILYGDPSADPPTRAIYSAPPPEREDRP